MTKNLLSNSWITHFETYRKVVVGFSAGLDSTVLLHTLSSLPTLKNKLLAVHINHGISPKANVWQDHAEQISKGLGVEFKAQSIKFSRDANIEAQARAARYDFFYSIISKQDCLVLGHHKDDQVETLLLQLFRGAGIEGLSAMKEISTSESISIARPFLQCSRKDLERYALEHELAWVEDESNSDTRYSRNFLRHSMIPLIEEKWPGAKDSIARAADHCQEAAKNLEELAIMDCPNLLNKEKELVLTDIRDLSSSRMINVLRYWLKGNAVLMPPTVILHRVLDEVLKAKTDAQPLVEWDRVKIRRYKDTLYLESSKTNESVKLDITVEALVQDAISKGMFVPENAEIEVKYRQGGERFIWHGQTKSLKKLFQEWGVPPWNRDKIPLIYINHQLAAVGSYAISDVFYKAF
ncbi:tRNA lysidine(34) synthetase TilS [Legionella waltersii]|uniref:tRNA(Ile)-lysidine synthase n=1 Tax=Legionella waltersii TaxID=66969 RepID=A0A0W1AN96_9GAMM|nr:tRNA lysidine(34) synthetase TilS [Legionella waltersii]KTD82773.1 cell cycle protein MesJ [Legionella waltersii]SNV01229.1 cell cycle protein MesJ [Legionella waltersii]